MEEDRGEVIATEKTNPSTASLLTYCSKQESTHSDAELMEGQILGPWAYQATTNSAHLLRAICRYWTATLLSIEASAIDAMHAAQRAPEHAMLRTL